MKMHRLPPARSMLVLLMGAVIALVGLPPNAVAAKPSAAETDKIVRLTADPVAIGTRTLTVTNAPDEAGVAATRVCALPYLGTGYGPVAQCTVVSGGLGKPGFYSPLTGKFNATAGPFSVVEARSYSWNNGSIIGYASLATGYGPVVWATQYSGRYGRWGTASVLQGTFVASSDWMPVA